ncbi:MAG: cyclic GMP-AMP synthase DncV-like nucleotidyltransferase [Solirubrobacterales bacterium]
MFDTTTDLVSRLLKGSVTHLDIPPELHAAATREYERVGGWLTANVDDGAGWAVHAQGSFLLNTVVLPAGTDEYDVDCVCRRQIDKEATSQQRLKNEVGEELSAYRVAHAHLSDAPRALQERSRCWTLGYSRAQRFHLDVLPAIPNADGGPTAILITDRDLREWQRSDPLSYAAWFKRQAEAEFLAKRLLLAEAQRTAPQAIPDWEVKTTLHRTVQVLKLHRNRFFADDLDSRPASILVTTLAALAYEGEQDLYGAVLAAVRQMPDHIQEGPAGRYSVPNPVEPREDFADRWRHHPALADRFFEWLGRLEEDLREAESLRGLDRVVARLSESFGDEPVVKAAASLGDEFRRTRERGALALTGATGVLSTKGSVPVRNHDFYGEIG